MKTTDNKGDEGNTTEGKSEAREHLKIKIVVSLKMQNNNNNNYHYNNRAI